MQTKFFLNTCLTILTIVVYSGASRQEHKKKEIHTTKETMNYAVKKFTTIYTIS